jgi:assimilatory nitrate reductase catalytic subunit
MSLLMGMPSKDHSDGGRIVCSCFGVGINTLTAAIRDGGLVTVEDIGKTLKAGTNCGSCIPELKALIKEVGMPKVS